MTIQNATYQYADGLLLETQSQTTGEGFKNYIEQKSIPGLTRTLKPQLTVRVGTVTPAHLKKKLLTDYPDCMLGISLGNASMEEDKLEASIRWISENFTYCALVVGDSIYRYTLQATKKMSPEESKPAALQTGRDFIAKYDPMIDRYRDSCNFEWVCMSEVQQHANFEEHLQVYQQLYAENDLFQTLVDESSNKYLSGAFDMESLSAHEKAEKLNITINYFVEESAIFTCLCEENQCVLIYPGTIKPLQIITGDKIKGVPEPIRKLIQVRINLNEKGYRVVRDEKYNIPVQTQSTNQPKFMDKIKDIVWDTFLSYTKKKKYRAGDMLVFEGMRNTDLYILIKGHAEALTGNMETGQLTYTSTLEAPSFINEQTFLDGSPRTTTIAALTDCEVLFLPGKAFHKMLRINPEIAAPLLLDIAQALATRISHEKNKNYAPLAN